MVGAGCGLQVLQAGLLHHAFGGYLAVLQDDRAWNKTQLSGAAALQQMESAIIGPALGWIMDRFGPQGVIRLGVVMFGLGFMLPTAGCTRLRNPLVLRSRPGTRTRTRRIRLQVLSRRPVQERARLAWNRCPVLHNIGSFGTRIP